MKLLATKEGLEKDIKHFQDRVDFQTKYVELLRTNEYETELDRLEALDKAYEVEMNLRKNKSFVVKFTKSLKDIENSIVEAGEMFKGMPTKIVEASSSVDNFKAFLDEYRKTPKVTKKQKEEKALFLQGQEASYESCVQALESIIGSFSTKEDVYDELNRDYNTLDQIIKISTGQKAK